MSRGVKVRVRGGGSPAAGGAAPGAARAAVDKYLLMLIGVAMVTTLVIGGRGSVRGIDAVFGLSSNVLNRISGR